MPRELLLLDEMITVCERALEICRAHSVAELESLPDARDALLWNLTVLGEAANQLPSGFRAAHGSVRWRGPISLRNRIVHGYWSVDIQVVHNVAVRDLPVFLDAIRDLVVSLDQGE